MRFLNPYILRKIGIIKNGFSPIFYYVVLIIFSCASSAHAANYQDTILPLLKEYCITCHSTEKQKGDLDLEQFLSIEQIRKHPTIWENVQDQLASNEMPPKKKSQLSSEQKSKLTEWVQSTLNEIAQTNAGDPGPVILRRLSNFEYNYTIRDLTGVKSLNPTREFPIDGAAGEGFTNVGAALVMSPALLTKYLDAAKDIAAHAVPLPNGIRFSKYTTSRDWTDEMLLEIRKFYARFSNSDGTTPVDLQGIKFDTNTGGRLSVAKYLEATSQERDFLTKGTKTIADVARQRSLNAKYLGLLWLMLNDKKPSLLLDSLRAKWREGNLTASDIEVWQQSLWRFASVGHIGKKGGPKNWQEAVTPLATKNEIRMKLTAPADGSDVLLYLSTSDAGDGHENDFALWENARLVAKGRKDLPLRDLRALWQQLSQQRDLIISSAAKCLAAAAEAEVASERIDVKTLAQKHGVEAGVLTGWLDYLGISSTGEVKLGPLLVNKNERGADYDFIKSWSGENALSVAANSSDNAVRVPGLMKPHSVVAHPSPKLAVVIAWRSPVASQLSIDGNLQDAHPECGNGITWSLELRRGQSRQRLASGVSKGATPINMGPFEGVRVLPGDVIAVVIGPRDGNHSCDLTSINLTIHDGSKKWDLSDDISPDILAGNPHADSHGNKNVWHFYGEPATAGTAPTIPGGSLLTMWRKTTDAAEKKKLAQQVQLLLQRGLSTVAAESPNRALYKQLISFNGPLLSEALRSMTPLEDDGSNSPYGLDPAMFGKHPTNGKVDPLSYYVKAPSLIEVRLPGSLVDGTELVVNSRLHPDSGPEGSVQMQVLTSKPDKPSGIAAGKAKSSLAKGQWTDNNLRTIHSAPVIVNENSAARKRFETAFDDFRQLFPAALCYTKIVPVDEVVTLKLFYREDEHLRRLMLDDSQSALLDQLWDELLFVSSAPLKQVDVFEQLFQFATQDASPSVFEPMRKPILHDADLFKKRLVEVEPKQVQSVLEFATRAWRRPLTDAKQSELRTLYQKMREQELPHALALRMLLARVLVAPEFLYRGEKSAPGVKANPVDDWELATRLSYFLWASTPDEELNSLAASGKLHQPDVLVAQAHRMMKDEKILRLATEFGCQWLHIRDLETLDEKSERHFPTFLSLRGDMQEEAARFFVDLFQQDRSVLSLLDADHSYVNGSLAKHYNIDVKNDGWQRVEGFRAKGRGGILGFASTLSKQSGASRTSPILRGNWLSEVVLGEKLPRPPKDVPVLPDEAPKGLTERQLIERHTSDPTCARCHARIDPFGFALEGFDAIGRVRKTDAAGLAINTKTKLPGGEEIEGLEGLRSYLLTTRRQDFLNQFCRKLLGYSLGRSVQLSDKPLLEKIISQLEVNKYNINTAIELIVLSPQFREARGRDFTINP